MDQLVSGGYHHHIFQYVSFNSFQKNNLLLNKNIIRHVSTLILTKNPFMVSSVKQDASFYMIMNCIQYIHSRIYILCDQG